MSRRALGQGSGRAGGRTGGQAGGQVGGQAVGRAGIAPALALALILAAPSGSGTAAAQGALDGPKRYAFTVVDQPVDEVLRELAGAIGTPIDLGRGVEGRVTNFSGRYTPRGFLDALTADFGLTWYHDGTAIHVTDAQDNKSVVIDFDRVSSAELNAALEELGVADPRFALRETERSGIGVVTGPPRYVELVENAFLMLASRSAEGPVDRPPSEVHEMVVVRGEAVAVWRGAAAQVAEAQAAEDQAAGVAGVAAAKEPPGLLPAPVDPAGAEPAAAPGQ